MFKSTPQGPYLDRRVGSASSRFSDLVVASERIKNCLKSGKIQGVAAAMSNEGKKPYVGFPKKKEVEANATSTYKGKGKAYMVPYFQVAEVSPNSYQQQAFVIPSSQQPMMYQP